jgi:hypothetical protein
MSRFRCSLGGAAFRQCWTGVRRRRWLDLCGGAALAASLPLLAGACGGAVRSPTEPTNVPPGAALSFSQIQGEIFTPTCAKAGCHAASSGAGGMVLAAGVSYAQIVGRKAPENPQLDLVKPGNPDASYLVKKIRGDPDISGSRMPQDGPPFLTPQQIAGIEGWIQAGAPNN